MSRKSIIRPFNHSPMYGYVKSRALEGTLHLGPKPGVWFISSYRVKSGWGNVPLSRWPYDGSAKNWPPVEPPGMDAIAKFHRFKFYQRLLNLKEIKWMLAYCETTQISVPITKQWYSAPNGVIAMPSSSSEFIESHAVQPVGYNERDQLLTFANSWGVKWGDSGFGHLPYSYVDKYLQEGWHYCTERAGVLDRRLWKQGGIVEQSWGIWQPPLERVLHCLEFFDCSANERVGWTFISQVKDHLYVEELFVHPNYRRRQFGHKLGEYCINLSHELHLPIKFWISFADTDTPNSNLIALNNFFTKLRLQVVPSSRPWARYEAESRKGTIPSVLKIINPKTAPQAFLPE